MAKDLRETIELLESLNERAKELNCLYQTDEILKDYDSPLEVIFHKILEIIPPGWQFPEICEGRIVHNNIEYEREKFAKLQNGAKSCHQMTELFVDNKQVGKILVFYFVQPGDGEDRLYFLEEEQKLLDTMAERISNYLFNRRLKKTFGQWKEASEALDLLQHEEGKIFKILRNVNIEDLNDYLESPAKNVSSPEDLEAILETKSDRHWQWRMNIAKLIAKRLKSEKQAFIRFGVVGFYVFGSAKNANAGPASDIDILIHFRGNEMQRRELKAWLEGWSLCLSEMNLIKTGYRTEGLLDVHIITDDDIKRGDSYASKIGAINDPARPLKIGE